MQIVGFGLVNMNWWWNFLGGILLVAGFICGVIFRRLCRAMALESIEALVVRSR
jgi:hypothetical protein